MPTASTLSLQIEKCAVALHYAGAEGVTFEDAVLIVENNGASTIGEVVLGLRVSQEGKVPFEGNISPAILEMPDGLDAGASLRMSVFRVLQKTLPGFASKVNMFGYKAALNWSYEIVVSIGDAEALAKTIRWSLAPSDAEHVAVDIH
jgi:hypothetical protein